MGQAIPKEVKDLWDKWNVRGLVILSLALQTILVLVSPNRKRTHRRLFRFLIWSAYLLANWAAEYAVGQISENQGDEPQPKNNDLIAFWSTFLLLHLGGPDTITALALEDNNLWLRSLFGLVCQAIITLYVFLLSIPNNLLVPTSLMLVAGIIKYVERIKALRGASLDTFKDSMLGEPDPGPDYARLMDEYSVRKMHREPTQKVRIEEAEKGQRPKVQVRPNRKLSDLEVVQYAYKYFNIFKGLVVDLIFSSQSEQWNNSKEFFLSLDAEEALRVLEVELSFIYGTFYTKVDILHTRVGFAFRFIALASLVSSLWIFTVAKKHDYSRFDVGLTYALLIGGIVLEIVAFIIFCVSDWIVARCRKLKEDVEDKDTWVDICLNWLLGFRELNWKSCSCCSHKNGKCEVPGRKFIFRRWSEYIYAYNLIGYSLRIKPKRVHKTKGCIHGFFDSLVRFLCIASLVSCSFKVISYCFRTTRAEYDRLLRRVYRHTDRSSRMKQKRYYVLYPLKLFLKFRFGIPMIIYVLEFFGISDQLNGVIYTSRNRITRDMWELMFKEIMHRSESADGGENANGMYSTRGEWVLGNTLIISDEALRAKLLRFVTQVDYDQSILTLHIATESLYQTEKGTEDNHSKREFSKILSDYMMYLLIVQPDLMSTVAGIDKIRFMETIAAAKRFTEAKQFVEKNHLEGSDLKQVCRGILAIADNKETESKRYKRRDVLSDASRVTKTLLQLGNNDVTWEVVSKVWVEMLSYAATHCDPKQHVAQLCKGGEFLSFVWLLMAHFGLGEQFQTTEENARTRLVVPK